MCAEVGCVPEEQAVVVFDQAAVRILSPVAQVKQNAFGPAEAAQMEGTA